MLTLSTRNLLQMQMVVSINETLLCQKMAPVRSARNSIVIAR